MNEAAAPVVVSNDLDGPGTGDALRDLDVASFVASLSPTKARHLAADLQNYTAATTKPLPRPRFVIGKRDAPVRIITWTDLGAKSTELRRALRDLQKLHPADVAWEPKPYPRDGACNPNVEERTDPSARCLAARASICGESSTEGWSALAPVLDVEQPLEAPDVPGMNTGGARRAALSPASITAAAANVIGQTALEECLRSAETASKLSNDIRLATSLGIEAAPFVVVNGRPTRPDPLLLRALVLTRGAGRHPAFASLPTP